MRYRRAGGALSAYSTVNFPKGAYIPMTDEKDKQFAEALESLKDVQIGRASCRERV